MATREPYGLTLISDKYWPELVEDSFAGRGTEATRLADSLLFRFHDRHVGITPDLALGLAEVILDATSRSPNPWRMMERRLEKELDDRQGRQVLSKSRNYSFLLRTDIAYVVLQIALPLMAEACRLAKAGWIFCKGGPQYPFRKQAYKDYQQALSLRLGELMTQDPRLELFWKERALTLASQAYGSERSQPLMPLVAEEDFAVMWRLKAAPKNEHARFKNINKFQLPVEMRKTRRLNEGGIDGIHVTRREEDFSQILVSELANPPILFYQRLLNDGFFAFRRPILKERKRDLLIAALFIDVANQDSIRRVAQTCWCEALAQFSQVLTLKGLHNTEFRWIDCVKDKGMSGLSIFPERGAGPPSATKKNKRHGLLIPQGWMPDFLEMFPEYTRVTPGNDTSKDELAINAWKQQKDHPRWEPFDEEDGIEYEERLRLDRFTHVHLMLFQPGPKEGEPTNEAADQACLQGHVFFQDHASANLSITYFPRQLTFSEGWHWKAPGRHLKTLQSNSPNHKLEQLASSLTGCWLEQWQGELDAT